uniref:Transmembrane channel-like protein 7 n=2 Tax=Cacopsylla melanoneura TaxID=428564 RepID=A0A8D8UX85_9HEMI
MSGGERKKRLPQEQAWEEAGSEFYQESYAGAQEDLEAFQRDPNHLKTLLPSKQNRGAATNRRVHETKATMKRKTSIKTRYQTMTVRKGTTGANAEIQVSLLPDLSENLANEESTWEEIMKIKATPIHMSQKKELKLKLQNAETFRLQGLKQFKWQRRKLWQKCKAQFQENQAKWRLWESSLTSLEAYSGTGVTSLFHFTKWLLCVNMFTVLLMYPNYLLGTRKQYNSSQQVMWDLCDDHNDTTSIECCAATYENSSRWASPDLDLDTGLGLLIGAGWLEWTPFYYGTYARGNMKAILGDYNVSVGYLASNLAFFLVTFVLICKHVTNTVRHKIMERENGNYLYCNMVFSAWDYCLQDDTNAQLRQKAIYTQLKHLLDLELSQSRGNRHKDNKLRVMPLRLIINIIVLALLITSGYIVTLVLPLTPPSVYPWHILLSEYTVPLTIALLNRTMGFIFEKITLLENYNYFNVLRVTGLRCLILRLTNLSVFLFSLYSRIHCSRKYNECASASCNTPLCWESYVGQQIYKLIIADVVLQIVLTFFLHFPRSIFYKHLHCSALRQEFLLFQHYLDLVYLQLLGFLGIFYAPFLPLLLCLLLFVLFYVKKFACVYNCVSPLRVHYSSRCTSHFMTILFLCYVLSLLPISFSILFIMPSRSCGPFKGLLSVAHLVQDSYSQLPSWLTTCIGHVFTSSYFLLTSLFLLLVLYYYYNVCTTNREMVQILKKQLILEGQDKQFLLDRLSAYIKQQQDKQKAAMARSVN